MSERISSKIIRSVQKTLTQAKGKVLVDGKISKGFGIKSRLSCVLINLTL